MNIAKPYFSSVPTSIKEEFKGFILNQEYPCLGAKAAFNTDVYRMGYYSKLGSNEAAEAMAPDLHNFIAERATMDSNFTTFIAVFERPISMKEEYFEKLLWQQLSALHHLDDQPWNSSVSHDPDSKEFGFSFAQTAFFVIGLHANSSRIARRFTNPALVFNLHSQFDILKAQGKYQKMRKVIRKRDQSLQGYINPMAADFGTVTEARQYSGRKVSSTWQCPFLHKANRDE